MSLPLFSGVRKLEGLGITLSDLLKQLNELRNREPEVYEKIINTSNIYSKTEYIPIFIEVYQDKIIKELEFINYVNVTLPTISMKDVSFCHDSINNNHENIDMGVLTYENYKIREVDE